VTTGYTPVELRLLKILSDGERHDIRELLQYLNDDLANPSNVRFHVCKLRKKLTKARCSILCERDNGTAYYRLVAYYISTKFPVSNSR